MFQKFLILLVVPMVLIACASGPTVVGAEQESIADSAEAFNAEWEGRWQSVCKSASGRVTVDFKIMTSDMGVAHFEISNSPYPEFSKEASWDNQRKALVTDDKTVYLLYTLKEDGTLRIDYKNRRSGDCGYMTLAQA